MRATRSTRSCPRPLSGMRSRRRAAGPRGSRRAAPARRVSRPSMSPLQSTPVPARRWPLALAGGDHPRAHRRARRGAPRAVPPARRRHGLHLADEVDAVQQRAAEPPLVAAPLDLGAAAAIRRARARAAVARRHEDRVGRELERALPAHDLHAALLERLAQRLERDPRELGQLVEEQHAAVGERDLAGPGRAPPPTSPWARSCGAGRGRAARWRAARCRCRRRCGSG